MKGCVYWKLLIPETDINFGIIVLSQSIQYWLKQNKARFLNLGKAFENSARNTSTPMQLIIIER